MKTPECVAIYPEQTDAFCNDCACQLSVRRLDVSHRSRVAAGGSGASSTPGEAITGALGGMW
jgi:hypothetical protein